MRAVLGPRPSDPRPSDPEVIGGCPVADGSAGHGGGRAPGTDGAAAVSGPQPDLPKARDRLQRADDGWGRRGAQRRRRSTRRRPWCPRWPRWRRPPRPGPGAGELANLVTAGPGPARLGAGPARRAGAPTRGSDFPDTDGAGAAGCVHGPDRGSGARPGASGERRARRGRGRPPPGRRRARGGGPGPGRGPGLPLGDLTAALVPAAARGRLAVVRRAERGAGRPAVRRGGLQPRSTPTCRSTGGCLTASKVRPGEVVAEVEGPLRPILTAERTALNFLGHLSGVATLTRRYVDAVARVDPVGAGPRHPEDDTRPARPREGGGAGRAAATTTGPASPTPSWSRTTTWAPCRSPRPSRMAQAALARTDGRGRVRPPGPGRRGVPGRGHGRAPRQHGPRGGARPACSWCAGRPAGAQGAGRGLRRDHPRQRPAYAAAGVDLISVGRADPLGPGARPRPRPGPGRLTVLLAIDVGNTESVIGLYALTAAEGESLPPSDAGVGFGIGDRGRAARRGLTHHWRLSTVPDRTPDEHAVLLTQLLDLEGLDIAADGHRDRHQLLGARRHRRAASDGRAMVRRRFPASSSALGSRAACRSSTTIPRRWAPTGWPTPWAPTTSTAGPASSSTSARRRPSTPSREAGEYLGGAITPGVAISLEALFQHAAALRRVEMVDAARRDRALDRRVDPVGHPLRLRRPGRRPVPALHGGARAGDRGGHRRPVASSSPPTPPRSTTSSRGSPSTGCGSSRAQRRTSRMTTPAPADR